MKTVVNFVKKRLLIIAFLFLYFVFALYTYKDYGLTNDEFFVYARGKYFYTKVKGNDQFLQKGFAIKDRDNEDLLFNNSTYPALLYVFNDNESYEGYHLLNFFFAGLIFYAVYEVLLYVYKKPFLAIVGPIFLFFTPRFLGDIPANPKDIPFAVMYFLTIAAIFFFLKWNEKVRILMIGLLLGITASLRILGFTLLIVYATYLLYQYLIEKKSKSIFYFLHLILESFLIFLIGFLVFLVSMPYVAADPFNHFIELVKVGTSFPWFGKVLFFGKEYAVSQRPLLYLFGWITITTPFFILVPSIISIFTPLKKEVNSLKVLFIISICFQLILYFLIKPTVYNGLRHYLFLIPQLVVLATIFFNEIVKKKTLIIFVSILILANLVSITKSYFDLHPYEYVYFNALVNGLRGADGKFELDYWGASEKEALLWLKNYLADHHFAKSSVYVCSKSYSLTYYLPESKDANRFPNIAQYIICGSKNSPYITSRSKLIHIITRQNVPLQYIYDQNK
ncbi:hypothetical protein HY041_00455 [Candidatus Roizmanbacteria bacterium]|nr:hypothetical protein [Candidatus Roizmanbacteria bacterium]